VALLHPGAAGQDARRDFAAAPGARLAARFTLTLAPPPPPRGGRGAKPRPMGGWLAVCHGQRVLALKKCGLEQRRGQPPQAMAAHTLEFFAPAAPGTHELHALLLCDSAVGMDAVMALRVHVQEDKRMGVGKG